MDPQVFLLLQTTLIQGVRVFTAFKRVWGWSSGGVYLCRTFWVPPLGFEGSLKSQICKKFLHRHELQRISNQPNLPLVKFSFPKALKTTTTTTTTNKQKHCHATLISLSLPAEATQFFSSGCQSIANAGPLCPTCWMKGELVWRLSHNYNKKYGKMHHKSVATSSPGASHFSTWRQKKN